LRRRAKAACRRGTLADAAAAWRPPAEWRQYAFSEYDYAMLEARLILNQPLDDCRLYMVFDDRWKLVHAKGFRPMRGLCPRPAVRSGILIGYWDEAELAEARAVAA
jgi:hypothetical protein